MSGRKINEHASWMGKGKEYPLPNGPYKLKAERSAEGAGHVGSSYPDTSEDIHRDQEAGIRHVEGRKIKSGYRN